MRILHIADPHIDFDPHAKRRLFEQTVDVDAIVVAGDVANSEWSAEQFFEYFEHYECEKYAVPGNHDEWYSSQLYNQMQNRTFHHIARKAGFIVPNPAVTHEIRNGVLLFNLFYQADLTPAESMYTNDPNFMPVLARYRKTPELKTYEPVLFSVSHMSPRMDIPRLPEHQPSRMFINTDLDRIIRGHQSPVHLYGHTHYSNDITLEGVRYYNKTIGYDLRMPNTITLDEFVVEI